MATKARNNSPPQPSRSQHPTAGQSNSPHSAHVHKCKALQIKCLPSNWPRTKPEEFIHALSKQQAPLQTGNCQANSKPPTAGQSNGIGLCARSPKDKGRQKAKWDPGSKTKQKKTNSRQTDTQTDIQREFIFFYIYRLLRRDNTTIAGAWSSRPPFLPSTSSLEAPCASWCVLGGLALERVQSSLTTSCKPFWSKPASQTWQVASPWLSWRGQFALWPYYGSPSLCGIPFLLLMIHGLTKW